PVYQQDLANSVNELASDTDRLLGTVDQTIKEMSGPASDLSKLTDHLDNLDAKSQELGKKSQELKECLEVTKDYDLLEKVYNIVVIKINNASNLKQLTQTKEDASKVIASVSELNLNKKLTDSLNELSAKLETMPSVSTPQNIDQKKLNYLKEYKDATWEDIKKHAKQILPKVENNIKEIEGLRKDFQEVLEAAKERKKDITQIHSRYFGLANDINTLRDLIKQRSETG